MKVIAHQSDDVVVITYPNSSARMPNESEDAFLKRVIAIFPEGVRSRTIVVSTEDLPDPDFRGAWKIDRRGKKVSLDINAAKRIHMERIRATRDTMLERLDKKEIEAMSKGDSTSLDEVGMKKKALRDLPYEVEKSLSKCTTAEQIKSCIPSILLEGVNNG